MKPASIILDLLRTYLQKGTTAQAIMSTGAMFGFSENVKKKLAPMVFLGFSWITPQGVTKKRFTQNKLRYTLRLVGANTTFYCFPKRRFLPKPDFRSTVFRNDHLKMNPDARIYPMRILPTLFIPTFEKHVSGLCRPMLVPILY